jgi:hypothetical protein
MMTGLVQIQRWTSSFNTFRGVRVNYLLFLQRKSLKLTMQSLKVIMDSASFKPGQVYFTKYSTQSRLRMQGNLKFFHNKVMSVNRYLSKICLS